MFGTVLKKVFGSENERELKRLWPVVEIVNGFETQFREKTDDDLRAMTGAFRERLERGETLDDILPEAFATVREVSRRVLNMRHFDVQIIGGIVLHQGKIAEMATGEGKTLVATLPAYLNGLTGKGVHIVTVNDYLARRDREWMGKIYEFLGLTVDVVHHDITPEERQQAYTADITYGTNTEFGFDYLRDNMAVDADGQVQRSHYYAIIDEVDSILIDEARTPLIISGPVERSERHHFSELKPHVERLMKSQSRLISQLLTEAEKLRGGGQGIRGGDKAAPGEARLAQEQALPENDQGRAS